MNAVLNEHGYITFHLAKGIVIEPARTRGDGIGQTVLYRKETKRITQSLKDLMEMEILHHFLK